MINGLLGKKIKMSSFFDDEKGEAIPITILQIGPCKVTQVKTMAKDGYESVQIGFEPSKRLNKPLKGHLKRAGEDFKYLREFESEDINLLEVGQTLDCEIFEVGDEVAVTGISKGKGFAGTVKRYHFKGGPKTHGQSDRLRAPGSIGAGSSPGRVWKGTKMSGRLGSQKVTQSGLQIISINRKENLVSIKGAVPGAIKSLVMVRKQS